ncbi:MAG: hypothetical protein ABJA02_16445 [Acidobacteriota bacterium]
MTDVADHPEIQTCLEHLPIGSRLLVRSRKDWRFAAISKLFDGRVILTVCSPCGRTYRMRRELNAKIVTDGPIPVLISEYEDDWRENFGNFDCRW